MPEQVSSIEIGKYLIEIVSKSHKVCIDGAYSSDSLENSKKNLQIMFKELIKVNPSLALKYSNSTSTILDSKACLERFINDLMSFSDTSLIETHNNLIVSWLKSLNLLKSNEKLTDLIVKSKTGVFLCEIAKKLTKEDIFPNDSKNMIQCLDNINKGIETLFNYGLLPHFFKEKVHSIYSGDLSALILLLKTVKHSIDKQKSQNAYEPKEYKNIVPVYRSVTPPPFLHNL